MSSILIPAEEHERRAHVGRVAARHATASEMAHWDQLVTRFPGHRVMHRAAWIRSLEESVRGRAVFLVFESAGKVVGCLPGLVTRLGPLTLFGSPLPGWQTASLGPVFDSRCASTRQIISAAVEHITLTYGANFIELINAHLDHDDMRALGFRGFSVPTCRAPLFPEDEERTFKQLKDSARRNVKRALRLGLEVRFDDGEPFVAEAYDQMREVFIRGGHQVPFSKRRVQAYVARMKAAHHLVAASVVLPDGGPPIAVGLFTIDAHELLLWQWAHRTAYRWYRPTELMTWTVMQRALRAGCRTFDMMGLGTFKANFGAVVDDTQYRWMWSRHGTLLELRDLAEIWYRRQQSARGQLARWWRGPLRSANTATGTLSPP